MSDGRETLLLVTARGGSKGLPGKNLREVGGLSLVGRAVSAARQFRDEAGLPAARIVVDTDAEDIAAEGRAWGAEVPFLRALELARDDTSSVDTVLGLVDRLRSLGKPVTEVVLLQPTVPLRTAEDVLAGWTQYRQSGAPLVVSLVRDEHPPEFCVRLAADGGLSWAFGQPARGHRRQDFAPAFRPNGAVYIVRVAFLAEQRSFFTPGLCAGYEMPAERSVDIDSAFDLSVAEARLAASRPDAPPLPGSTLRTALFATRAPGAPPLTAAERGALRALPIAAIEGDDPTAVVRHRAGVAHAADGHALQRERGGAIVIEAGAEHPARLWEACRNATAQHAGAVLLLDCPALEAVRPTSARALALSGSLQVPAGLAVPASIAAVTAAWHSDVPLVAVEAHALAAIAPALAPALFEETDISLGGPRRPA